MGEHIISNQYTLSTRKCSQVYLNWLVFIFSPILGFIIAWSQVLRRNYRYIYILASLFPILGAFFPPLSDSYRYRILYLNSTSFDFDFSSLFYSEKDFLYYWLSCVFNNIGCTYEAFKLIIFLICYWLYAWMYIDIIKHSKVLSNNKKTYVVGVICILFIIRLFTLCNGIRFGIASTIVIIAMYQLFRKRIKWGILWLSVACCMHFSILMVVPCIFGTFFLQYVRLKRWVKFSIIFVLIILSHSGIGDILSALFPTNDLMSNNINVYIEGKWNTDSLMATASVGGLIFTVLRILPVIPLAYFVISDKQDYLQNLGFMLLIVLSISFSSYTILLRYSNIAIAILFVAQLVSLKSTKKELRKLKVSCAAFICVFATYVYTQREPLTNVSTPYKALLSPILLYDSHSYSQDWINRNINSEGELRNQ
ncbi:MAG: EpsG family protein [Bacteroidales bacterium]|nr:EpsG family protein [Bacteroidales bacterium]